MGDVEQGGQFLDVFGGGLGLAVEDGCGGYFIAADVLGDLFEAELFGGFGVEEGCGCDWEIGVLGGLVRLVSC